MATRRKYKPKGYYRGGAVKDDMPIAGDAPPRAPAENPQPVDDNPLPPEPAANRLIEALAAQRRAEELQRQHAAQSAPTHQEPPQAPQLPEEALAWLQRHPEFAQDPVLNQRLGAVHNFLVMAEGVAPFSEAYFDAIDKKFGFKAAPRPAPAAPQRKSMPMSAPVTRDVPQAAGRRPEGWNTLTAEEAKIARNSFSDPTMTDAQKEMLYLQNKRRYLQMQKDGSYSRQGDG